MNDARHQLGERAGAWIDASLEDLAADLPGETVLTPTKRHGELAMVAALLLDRAEDARARRWLEHAWQHYEAGALLAREIAANPGNSAMYGAFHRHGLRSDEVERAIAEALPRADDPTLKLLLACSLARTNLAMPWTVDDLLAASFLADEPPTWRVTDRAAYVITHVVLFLDGEVPDRYRRYVTRSLPAWIAQFVRAGDHDLVGEMIMTAHALGTCVPMCEWQVLVDAQESDGLIPFRAAWRNREAPRLVRCVASYHSTLAAHAAAGMCAARCAQ